ncbi:MAG: hypothetical protein R3E01_28510 [Pirellulaceae bacterium]|nr:hypothetical protein [Planctomycetales bacterium]
MDYANRNNIIRANRNIIRGAGVDCTQYLELTSIPPFGCRSGAQAGYITRHDNQALVRVSESGEILQLKYYSLAETIDAMWLGDDGSIYVTSNGVGNLD